MSAVVEQIITMGHRRPDADVSRALRRLVQSRHLRREKRDGVWVYYYS